ncbi:C4-dicarboxylate transporter DctM subunit [Caldalkalibacillus uzonensis]|uniref:C4-dicarboxylate transporter DctM subunit n=1 Tax=Caldalkalibacillus uzonensis TaxID=353224 RepID=A0ABU0CPD0_9BACI|nr:TRAP transporter large permease [Caldalkalibacillus uzonensis]MDQ0338271.1 C4-dicarboxylate transporter DctM subunit [Caldalkalibacillus uzonensis]
MALLLVIAMFALFFIGVPVAISLGFASTIAIWWDGTIPLIIVAQRLFTSVDLFPLMAIPFFILAGTLMEAGGISQRLINFANALTGHMTGGLALVAVVTSMFFAAVSGSSAATVAAIGSILIPAMIKRGYHKNFSGGIQSISGELGVIIPPSIPMILYGVTTETSIRDMFIAGIIPGIFIGISLLLTVYIIAKKRGYKGDTNITWADRKKAFKEALLPLIMPVIILGGIYGGVFTPTEAGAVAVAYAFIVGVFVYKEIKWKEVIQLLSRSVVMSSIIMFIIANAGLFGWILSREGVPQMAASFFAGISDSPIIFLLIINALLLFIGMFIETSVSIILLAPLLMPVAMHMGIDPVHFGIIMIVNLAIGMCTPPLGVNLFISCQIANISLIEITKAIIPFLLVMIINVLIISYVPWLSTWLVQLLN